MTPLEQLAKELFVKFAKQESGIDARWDYLNNARKIAWMNDALLIATYILSELQKEVKPVTVPSKVETSYQMGYTRGQSIERTHFISILEARKHQLEEEYAKFVEKG